MSLEKHSEVFPSEYLVVFLGNKAFFFIYYSVRFEPFLKSSNAYINQTILLWAICRFFKKVRDVLFLHSGIELPDIRG